MALNIRNLPEIDSIQEGDLILIETPQGTRILKYENLRITEDLTSFAALLSAHTEGINTSLTRSATVTAAILGGNQAMLVGSLSSANALSSSKAFFIDAYKTELINNILSFGGHISGRGIVFASGGGTSDHWMSVYNSVRPLSAIWYSTAATMSSMSARWESAYITESALSARWESVYSVVTGGSASWGGGSTKWTEPGGNITHLTNTGNKVSIGQDSSEEKLTVAGNISASGSLYDLAGNSEQWRGSRTTVNTKSAAWDAAADDSQASSAYTTASQGSADWQGTYVLSQSNSSRWESTYSNVSAGSGSWESTYLQIQDASTDLNVGGDGTLFVDKSTDMVGIGETQPEYALTVNGEISGRGTIYAHATGGNSEEWKSARTIVNANSARWYGARTIVNANSARWESNYVTTSPKSGKWETTYSTVTGGSAEWDSVYASVSPNSARWESNYITSSPLTGRWESVYSVVTGNSGQWGSLNASRGDSAYSTISGVSADWVDGSGSANYLSKWSDVDTIASSVVYEAGSKIAVGLGAQEPDHLLTIAGDISARGVVYAHLSGGNSEEWKGARTIVNANSGRWESVYTTTSPKSGKWETAYSTVTGGSADWTWVAENSASKDKVDTLYVTVPAGSGRWESVYTAVTAGSAIWNLASDQAFGLSVYSNVSSYSAMWTWVAENSGDNDKLTTLYETIPNLSGRWESVYSNVTAHSAGWNNLKTVSGRSESTYTTVSAHSGGWNLLKSSSGRWESVYTAVTAGSAIWQLAAANAFGHSVYTTVSAHSGGWNTLKTLTGRHESAYTTVSAHSGGWNLLKTSSGRWEGAYTGVSALSTMWYPNGSNEIYTMSAVGIKIADPEQTLTISGDVSARDTIYGPDIQVLSIDANPSIIIGDTATANDYGQLKWHSGTSSFRIGTQSNQNVINIPNSTGFVGIGTTSPNKKLTVIGDISATGRVYIEDGKGGWSGEWDSVYNTVTAFSADWQSSADTTKTITLYTTVTGGSGRWESVYSTVTAYSAQWVHGLSAAGGSDVEISFRAHRNGTAQSINGATNTVVQFNSVDFNELSKFSTTDYKFTPQVPGRYMLNAGVAFDNLSDGTNAYIYIRKNGTDTVAEAFTTYTGSSDPTLDTVALLEADTDDYFTVAVRHDDSSTRDIKGTPTYTYFEGYLIGGGNTQTNSVYSTMSAYSGIWTWVAENSGALVAGWEKGSPIVKLSTASDRVGIGTDTPGAKLEVETADSENYITVLLDQNDTGAYPALKIDSESSAPAIESEGGGISVLQNKSSQYGLKVLRDISEAGSYPLVSIVDDNTANEQSTLRVQQDGSGDIVNVFDGSTEVFTVIDGGNVGIGEAAPGVKLTVGGVLSANGEFYTTGNAMVSGDAIIGGSDITIKGSSPKIQSNGANPIYIATNANDRIYIDGSSTKVGIGTVNPSVELAVAGSISARDDLYVGDNSIKFASGEIWSSGNVTSVKAASSEWNSGYTSTNESSGSWTSAYTSTNATSAKAEGAYTSTNETSARAESAFTTINATSAATSLISTLCAKIQSTYTSVTGNSGTWNLTNAARGNSAYTTVSGSSANWEGTYVLSQSNSGRWESVYSIVTAGSATWDTASSNSRGDSGYTTTNAGSANWQGTYVLSQSNTGRWESAYTALTGNSAEWEGARTVTNDNSAQWLSQYTTVSAYSGDWQLATGWIDNGPSVYLRTSTDKVGIGTQTPNTELTIQGDVSAQGTIYDITTNSIGWGTTWTSVNANSSVWDWGHTLANTNSGDLADLRTSLTSNTGRWESTYSITNSNSSEWETAYSTVSAYSATWAATNATQGNTSYTAVTGGSARWDKSDTVYTTVSGSSASWQGTYVLTQSNSSRGESVYSTVTGSSATWNAVAAGWTDDGSVVRLTTAGDNVAIGTAGDTGVKLSIVGNISASGSLSAGGGGGYQGWRKANKNWLQGWTGIGTDAECQLHVSALSSQDSYYGRVAQFDSNHYTSWLGFDYTTGYDKRVIGVSGNDIIFGRCSSGQTPTSQMRIASSGYVGINTESPANLLHIYGGENHLALLESTDEYSLISFKDSTSTEQDNETWIGGHRRQIVLGTQNTTRLIITSGGEVGINTSQPTTSQGAYTNIKLHVNGQALADAWPTTSDRRLKENIVPIENGLSKVLSLSGVTFDWEDGYASDTARSPKRTQIGMIAQDVQEVVPELVATWSLSGEDYLGVDYARMVAVLVEAIKELKQEVDELKSQNS